MCSPTPRALPASCCGAPLALRCSCCCPSGPTTSRHAKTSCTCCAAHCVLHAGRHQRLENFLLYLWHWTSARFLRHLAEVVVKQCPVLFVQIFFLDTPLCKQPAKHSGPCWPMVVMHGCQLVADWLYKVLRQLNSFCAAHAGGC